jgi:translation initiation factor 2B subunit (eIF-2B alpha/beta/delta family)
LIFFASEALRRAEERVDALDAKLKLSEKAREKAEKDAAAIEGLRQRLQTAEDALSDKVAQQIERKNVIVTRLEM